MYKDWQTSKMVYYHGANAKEMFTYRCGCCGASVKSYDKLCPECRRIFVEVKGVKCSKVSSIRK